MVSDEGHAAGKRMRDYDGFSNPDSPKNALLVECGQHWEKASADVALETTLRFLQATGVVAPGAFAAELARFPAPVPQSFVEIVAPVTIETDDFRFTDAYVGQEVIARAGTVIAHDGGKPVVTPHDDTVLIMPNRRPAKGQTAVRLGRFVEGA